MRLVAQAKCGYFPTPETVTRLVVQKLSRPADGLIRLIDPCAGEGTALTRVTPKEKELLALIKTELAAGRKILVYIQNSDTTDISPGW